ncbi:MAG: hypothetical protein R3B47_21080 [Bacteroidia bacterium]
MAFSDKVLNETKPILAKLSILKENLGLAFMDVSTGIFGCSGDAEYASKILGTLSPSEVLVSKPICAGLRSR